MLEENEAFIRAITDFQNMGKLAEASELQKRLYQNIIILNKIHHEQFGPQERRKPMQPEPSDENRVLDMPL